MTLDLSRTLAIARKELATWLANPTSYVFLTAFIAATGAAAFLQADFFARGLADLAALDRWMPIVLVAFVPALTMTSWAEERRAGTDELLLTMPVRDDEVVGGKVLGHVAAFSVALALSLAHVVVLSTLGRPDFGLVAATFLGYWLAGAVFVAMGSLASQLSSSPTVAYVLGVSGCAALVFVGATPWAAGLLGMALGAGLGALIVHVVAGGRRGVGLGAAAGAGLGALAWLVWPGATWLAFVRGLDLRERLQWFGKGVVELGDVVFHLGTFAVLVALGVFLVSRRRW
jgi:ABC-2 type transport system permease protein